MLNPRLTPFEPRAAKPCLTLSSHAKPNEAPPRYSSPCLALPSVTSPDQTLSSRAYPGPDRPRQEPYSSSTQSIFRRANLP